MGADWVQQYNEAACSLDAERWILNFFLPDAIWFFGNSPPSCGHTDLLEAAKAQFDDLESMDISVHSVDITPSRTYVQQTVDYRLRCRDGDRTDPIVVSQLCVFHKAPTDARISRADTFADLSALRRRLHELQTAQSAGVT